MQDNNFFVLCKIGVKLYEVYASSVHMYETDVITDPTCSAAVLL